MNKTTKNILIVLAVVFVFVWLKTKKSVIGPMPPSGTPIGGTN